MKKLRHIDTAALYLFFWLAVQMFFSFILPSWASFSTIFACALPIFCLARESAYGARDTNARRFRKRDYLWLALFFISGCVLLSFFTSYLYLILGGKLTANQTTFLYGLVFSCLMPAFFEEWLFRGHILRLCSVYGGAGVLLTGFLFGFSHFSVVRVPYAVFAGILLSALVYLTENIYLGMVLHAVSNFVSLCLSRIQGASAAKLAIGMTAVIFCISFILFHRSILGYKMRRLFHGLSLRAVFSVLSPSAILYFLVTAAIIICNSI